MTRRRKLTPEQVLEIRAQYLAYVRGYGTLAKIYQVGESTIRDIVQFATYVNVRPSATKNKAQAAVTVRASDQLSKIGF